MDSLPIEVVGNILSHVASAREVAIASETCRKWRQATRHHLHKLIFAESDCPRDLLQSQCEILITETIMRTSCLQDLTISVKRTFSAALVIAWLMHTKETLKSLTFRSPTEPPLNIFEKCGGQKIEHLVWGSAHIPPIDPVIHKFPSLVSLTLEKAVLSALDLNLLFSVCPKLEFLSLINNDISVSDTASTIELKSASMKTLNIEGVSVESIVLEADKLKKMVLRASTFEQFELLSQGSLEHLTIEDVSISHLEIGQSADLLEEVIVCDFTVMWPEFYKMISGASKLKKLRLCGLLFHPEEEAMDLKTISLLFPGLHWLALNYHHGDHHFQHGIGRSALFEKVVILELGTSKLNELFVQWIASFLGCCPKLQRLTIYATVSEAKSQKDFQMIGKFTSSMIDLMRQFSFVDVKFEFS